MAKRTLDKETRKALTEARELIQSIIKTGANEAETRWRIEPIFSTLMGYDAFKHITREYSVENPGDTDYCDFAIVIDETAVKPAKPCVLVEIKRVSTDLSPKHLKQAVSYAVNAGCEWVILTNGQEWSLYHITFGQPPETTLIEHWNLITDEYPVLADKFGIVGYKNVKKGGLAQLWSKFSVLIPHNVLKIILSESSIASIRRELKRTTNVPVSQEEVVGAVRRLLNESAVAELKNLKIVLPDRRIKKSVPPVEVAAKTECVSTPPQV
ncbi:MAG TPA: type I restriction enzyme HsdR N-terminal domain-containing protein [Dehalococcoidales bacterium]